MDRQARAESRRDVFSGRSRIQRRKKPVVDSRRRGNGHTVMACWTVKCGAEKSSSGHLDSVDGVRSYCRCFLWRRYAGWRWYESWYRSLNLRGRWENALDTRSTGRKRRWCDFEFVVIGKRWLCVGRVFVCSPEGGKNCY